MTLRAKSGHPAAEDVADLQHWLRELRECPEVTETVVIACDNAAHGGAEANWFYVEADAAAAVARRRCLSCGQAHHLLDSAEHWTHPHMWQCDSCGQSIAELAAGLHTEDGGWVTWVALACRCVECGTVAGLTDFTVDASREDATSGL